MFEDLTEEEKEVMYLLAEGLGSYDIMGWLQIDYNQYLIYKNNVFKKLKIKRAAQILPEILKLGLFK